MLKSFWLNLLIMFLTAKVSGQQLLLHGQVIESVNHAAVPYVSVEQWTADSMLAKTFITDGDGRFSFETNEKNCTLKFYFAGYDVLIIKPEQKNNKTDIKLTPVLSIKKGTLQEVVVTGRKSTHEFQLDKQVVDAKKFQTAANGTALELIQKMPSVTVTNEGEIALRGSTGFIVLINGKPSNRQPADILSQLPANQIENVEIITSPSVKYDSDGRTGILNIVTKKQAGLGWSISGNSMFGGLNPLRFGGDLQLNYSGQKWSAYAAADYRRYNIDGYRKGEVRTLINDTLNWLPSDGIRNYKDYQYSTKAGFTWSPTNKNSINASFYHGKKETDRIANLHYRSYLKKFSGYLFDEEFATVSDRYFNKNLFVRSGTFTTASIDYTHSFINKSAFSFTAVYEYSVLGGPLHNSLETEDTHYVYAEEFSDERSPLHGIRLQADYSIMLNEAHKLETGLVWRHLNQQGNFDYRIKSNETGNEWFFDPAFNDRIKLQQNIQGAYIQLNGKRKDVSYNLGFRGEYMQRELKDVLTVAPFQYDLFKLFPSAQGLWQPGGKQKIRVGYSKRIDWPSSKLISPFKNHRHQEAIELGDANLRPEIADIVELSYSKSWNKASISATAYYNFVKDKIFRVNDIYSPGILLRTYTNAGNAVSAGVELSSDITITKWWKLYVSGNLYQFTVKGTVKNGMKQSQSFNYNSNANTTVTISPKLKFQWDLTYVSASVTSQGKDSYYLLSNAGMKYNLPGNTVTLGLQLNNIFDTNVQTIQTEAANFYSTTDYIKYDRVLQLSVGFRLNESSRKIKTIKTEYGEKDF